MVLLHGLHQIGKWQKKRWKWQDFYFIPTCWTFLWKTWFFSLKLLKWSMLLPKFSTVLSIERAISYAWNKTERQDLIIILHKNFYQETNVTKPFNKMMFTFWRKYTLNLYFCLNLTTAISWCLNIRKYSLF